MRLIALTTMYQLFADTRIYELLAQRKPTADIMHINHSTRKLRYDGLFTVQTVKKFLLSVF